MISLILGPSIGLTKFAKQQDELTSPRAKLEDQQTHASRFTRLQSLRVTGLSLSPETSLQQQFVAIINEHIPSISLTTADFMIDL